MLTSKSSFSSLKPATRLRLFLLAGISIVFVVTFGYYLYQSGTFSSSPPKVEQSAEEIHSPAVAPRKKARPDYWPGIRQPPTRSARQAGLADDSEVIGVCIGGKARAYRVAALSGEPQFHVVNDVLAGLAVSVANCEITGCIRTFTATTSDAPLDLGVGGWNGDKGMMLQIGSVKYSLEDGKNLTQPQGPHLPYQRLEHERTTWGQWRRSHPDTDVYMLPPPR